MRPPTQGSGALKEMRRDCSQWLFAHRKLMGRQERPSSCAHRISESQKVMAGRTHGDDPLDFLIDRKEIEARKATNFLKLAQGEKDRDSD